MTLFSIGKDSNNRKNPTVNQNDHVPTRMAHGTTQFHNKTESDTSTSRLAFPERQLLAVQDGTNKAVFGFLSSSNKFGIRVAPDGTDVLTASDDELIFNSDQNVFKIVGVGTIQGTLPPATGFFSTSITHNLGYTPAIIAFIPAGGSSNLATPFLQFDATSGINIEQTRVEVDDTSVILKLYAPSAGSSYAGGFTRQAKYYLLQETAN